MATANLDFSEVVGRIRFELMTYELRVSYLDSFRNHAKGT